MSFRSSSLARFTRRLTGSSSESRSMRISRGPSELKLKPRSAESIWSEETPMSMRPVDGIPADPVQRRFEFTIAGVHEMDAIPERSQTDTRKLKGLRVPVQTAQKALAARTLHDGKGMAAHADRAVEIAPARFWGQRVQPLRSAIRKCVRIQEKAWKYRNSLVRFRPAAKA